MLGSSIVLMLATHSQNQMCMDDLRRWGQSPGKQMDHPVPPYPCSFVPGPQDKNIPPVCGHTMVLTEKILGALFLEGLSPPDRLSGPLVLHHQSPGCGLTLGVPCSLGSASGFLALTDLGTSSPTAASLGSLATGWAHWSAICIKRSFPRMPTGKVLLF